MYTCHDIKDDAETGCTWGAPCARRFEAGAMLSVTDGPDVLKKAMVRACSWIRMSKKKVVLKGWSQWKLRRVVQDIQAMDEASFVGLVFAMPHMLQQESQACHQECTQEKAEPVSGYCNTPATASQTCHPTYLSNIKIYAVKHISSIRHLHLSNMALSTQIMQANFRG
eukprot:260652-Pelagomonas_calceolata.AAC.3